MVVDALVKDGWPRSKMLLLWSRLKLKLKLKLKLLKPFERQSPWEVFPYYGSMVTVSTIRE